MIERSRRTVLLLDVSEFGVRAVDRICTLSALDDVVSDGRPDRRLARATSRANLSLHLAPARREHAG
jgi:DeoR/GlpR family transcriptional regulator of sugar metabolism